MVLTALTCSSSSSQSFVREIESIPVTVGGQPVSLPWAGGINSPEFQFVDIDGDGDLDLFIMDRDNNGVPQVDFYRNEGTQFIPNLKLRPHVITLPSFSYWFLFLDLNGDGLIDLTTDTAGSRLNYYQNAGTPQLPRFVLAVGSMLDSSGIPINAGSNSLSAFTDIDGDGRIDFFSGNSIGTVNFYRNVGSPSVPNFSLMTNSWQNILVISGGSCGGYVRPSSASSAHGASAFFFADLDRDSDPDLLWGDFFATGLYYFRNDGSPQNPAMVLVDTNCFPSNQAVVTLGGNQPSLVDIDGDGDLDFFVGVGVVNGALVQRHSFLFYENVGDSVNALFTKRTEDYLSLLDVGRNAHPVFVDLDGDSRRDLLIGNVEGNIWYFRNVGSVTSPSFMLVDTAFAGISGGYTYAPAFADIDHDGDEDLFIGRFDGSMKFYRNTGSPTTPQFVLAPSPVDTIRVTYDNAPAFVDIDNDSDFDLSVGGSNGRLKFYRNVGSDTNFVPVLESSFYDSITVGQDSEPTFVDIDADGDYDLFIGTSEGRVEFYRNIGNFQNPQFSRITNHYASTDPVQEAVPAFVDVDGDGDQDLFVGTLTGGIHFYRNQGAVSVGAEPAGPENFRLYQNFPNPFNPNTKIEFSLGRAGYVNLKVYDLLGREVATLVNAEMKPGKYEVSFSSGGGDASNLASGVYLYRLVVNAGNPQNPIIFRETKKLILLR